jgi:hypothetical protein
MGTAFVKMTYRVQYMFIVRERLTKQISGGDGSTVYVRIAGIQQLGKLTGGSDNNRSTAVVTKLCRLRRKMAVAEDAY